MRSARLLAVLGAIWFSVQSLPVRAAPRIVSINLCTDQIVLALADHEQILGLSPYARDPQRSWMAAAASRFPILSGTAEDVLVLAPDIVFAGTFTKRATRDLLKQQGLRVVEFPPARSIAEVQRQIGEIGALLGQPERAEAMVRDIGGRVAAVRSAARATRATVLPLFRRGWVSGQDTLIGSLIDTLGLRLAGGATTKRLGGFVTLEEVVALRPDLLLMTAGDDSAMDQGAALLRHSALNELYPPQRRVVIPETLTACGGPMIAEALTTLARALEHGPGARGRVP